MRNLIYILLILGIVENVVGSTHSGHRISIKIQGKSTVKKTDAGISWEFSQPNKIINISLIDKLKTSSIQLKVLDKEGTISNESIMRVFNEVISLLSG